MEIRKFYLIKTGYDNSDGNIYWYEDIELENYQEGYKWYQFLPSQYPTYTTFEESEKAVIGDWQGELYEYRDNYAKILEYTADSECGGHFQLTHEWYYKHDGVRYQRIGEKGFEYDKW